MCLFGLIVACHASWFDVFSFSLLRAAENGRAVSQSSCPAKPESMDHSHRVTMWESKARPGESAFSRGREQVFSVRFAKVFSWEDLEGHKAVAAMLPLF